jgi:oligopeptide transport system ATP-binding protein
MTGDQQETRLLLDVQQVTKTFSVHGSETIANRQVSLSMREGESVALVGESGSGKSTLARIICGLEHPDSGQVRLLDVPVVGASAAELRAVYRKVQMVFQNPVESFNPRRKLGASILDAARHAGMDKARAQELLGRLLDEVGLPRSYADRYPSQVSGGECQRAAIARALALDPKLIICDECTSALDVLVQSRIVELLNRLRASRGIAMLFVCHDLALVPRIAERTVVMLSGVIVEQGFSSELIDEPRHPYTQLMRSSVFPARPDEGWSIPTIVERESTSDAEGSGHGCPFWSRCPHAMERCEHELPELAKEAPGHFVRCWARGHSH